MALPHLVSSYPNVTWDELSIALIGPNEAFRDEAATVLAGCQGADVHELSSYPAEYDQLPRLLDENNDVIMIELDANPDIALELVERICAHGKSTVMVYSSDADPHMLVRCMRAGAREFLSVPFKEGAVEEALLRACVRQPKVVTRTVRAGRVLVFVGAKGGVGVTSIACNFAVALAQDRDYKTALIDLDLPLGDCALNLGLTSEFSTIDALQAASAHRLDAALLSKMLVKHKSGLRVLTAPGRFPRFEPTPEAIEKLLDVARKEFDNVVVDVGSRLDPAGTALNRDASRIYLVTQAGIPELRNANRLINQAFADCGTKLEVVLNRFHTRMGIPEKNITDALTRPVQWKIPNDHELIRKMQISATPVVLSDNHLSQKIREMAKSVDGSAVMAAETKKSGKKGFSFFS